MRDLPEPFQAEERKAYCENDFGYISALENGRFRVYDAWKDLYHPFPTWGEAFAFFKMLCRINRAKF